MRWHEEERAYLVQVLQKPFEGKTVVLTLHAPHAQCSWGGYLGERQKRHGIAGGFNSDMTQFISQHDIDLWIYGHPHLNVDTVISGTRITAAQGGYPGEGTSDLAHLKHAGRVIEL